VIPLIGRGHGPVIVGAGLFTKVIAVAASSRRSIDSANFKIFAKMLRLPKKNYFPAYLTEVFFLHA